MPAGDGTGPLGMGPMTGRRAGWCAGHDTPGYANPARGRGMGRARGLGRRGGRGRRWAGAPGRARPWRAAAWEDGPVDYGPSVPPTREEQVEFLRDEASRLQQQLQAVQERITELEEPS
jgi:hypothetical protein